MSLDQQRPDQQGAHNGRICGCCDQMSSHTAQRDIGKGGEAHDLIEEVASGRRQRRFALVGSLADGLRFRRPRCRIDRDEERPSYSSQLRAAFRRLPLFQLMAQRGEADTLEQANAILSFEGEKGEEFQNEGGNWKL